MSWLQRLLDGGILTNLMFLIIAVVSVLISISLYIRSKKEKKLVFIAKSYELIENSTSSIENLTIKYGEESVEVLTLTKLSFWNNGKATIDFNDIVKSDRLRVELPKNVRVYNAVIEMPAKKSNSIKLDIVDNKITIEFEFLDYGDGAIVIFYHSGSNEQGVHLTGTLKGALPIEPAEEMEDLRITKYVGRVVFRKYFDGYPKDFNIVGKFILFSLMPLMTIIILILIPIDLISYKFFKKIPKQFNLIDKGKNVAKKDNNSKLS
ncbi:hypothetical protein AAIR29_01900 [Psychrobacter sp. FBL11]|uniref:Uncharacterized protein n=1 Tax=Psychrobacter saeujeotis TaxID=3143436 RepID=A0ABU9X4Q7_9GAMM|nr:hypothetical protein [uncultured Psychrobacter sp.]